MAALGVAAGPLSQHHSCSPPHLSLPSLLRVINLIGCRNPHSHSQALPFPSCLLSQTSGPRDDVHVQTLAGHSLPLRQAS